MSLSIKMYFITLSFFIATGLNAQNKAEYQTDINNALAKGNCPAAIILYKAYVELFGVDSDFKKRINECNSNNTRKNSKSDDIKNGKSNATNSDKNINDIKLISNVSKFTKDTTKNENLYQQKNEIIIPIKKEYILDKEITLDDGSSISSGTVVCLDVSNERLLYSAINSKFSAVIKDFNTGQIAKEIIIPNESGKGREIVSACAFFSDKSIIALSCWSGNIFIYNIENNTIVKKIKAHRNKALCSINALSLSSDNKHLISTSESETILWDISEIDKIKKVKNIELGLGNLNYYDKNSRLYFDNQMNKFIMLRGYKVVSIDPLTGQFTNILEFGENYIGKVNNHFYSFRRDIETSTLIDITNNKKSLYAIDPVRNFLLSTDGSSLITHTYTADKNQVSILSFLDGNTICNLGGFSIGTPIYFLYFDINRIYILEGTSRLKRFIFSSKPEVKEVILKNDNNSGVGIKEGRENKTDAELKLKNEGLSNKFNNYTETIYGVLFKMLAIKGVTFTMGSPVTEQGRNNGDENQHVVTLNDYYIGTTEVTQALWQSVMGDNPSFFKGDDRPVENVSWDDCQTFILRLNKFTGRNYSLPSDEEWEYACRAGSTTPFSTGNNLTTDQANYSGFDGINSNKHIGVYRKRTISVETFAPNAFGLYDMHGNVAEWCSYTTGAGNYRLFRGGDFNSSMVDCRNAKRSFYERSTRQSINGFRLVAHR